MAQIVRVSDKHKLLLNQLVAQEKAKGLSPVPSQESVLNTLIEKEAKKKGISNE